MSSSRLVALAAAACTAIAAELSFGTLAYRGAGGARLGIVPIDARHLAVAALAGALVLAIAWKAGRARRAAVAVAPLGLLLLPWLPLPVPPAFLLWTGAIVSLAWIAAAIGLAAVALADTHLTFHVPTRRRALVPAAAGLAVFSLAAWLASPSIPGGDEPHYLVITQSLLYDHDLQIENNHRRGDYHAYFAGDLAPDVIARGRNGEIYSIHAPGLPALVLPAFAIGGYRGVVIFLILAASAACALAWWLAWRSTGSAAAAWFGWASVALSAPFLVESYTVYPDGLGAGVVLTGFWALLRAGWEADGVGQPLPLRGLGATRQEQTPRGGGSVWVWAAHGLALALLPWMHTRFSVLAATLGGLVLVRLARAPNPLPKAIAFLIPPAASAVAWMFFFAIVYGTPDPSAPYGGRVDNAFAFLPNGLGGLFFDQGFGLLATAPVLAIGLTGFARTRRLGLEWIVVASPYLLAVTTFAMWWAGMSGPARFAVPLVLPLAIPAACAWHAARSRGTRALMFGALAVSVWLSAVMVAGGGGRLAYHTRNEGGPTAAPWIDWANHAIDLPSALPAFVPLPVGSALSARNNAARIGWLATLPWLLCLGAAAAGVKWWIDRRVIRPAEAIVAAATVAVGGAAMVAMTLVWRLQAVAPAEVGAQLDALRILAGTRTVAFDLTHHRRLTAAEAWMMPIELPISPRADRGGRGLNRPLAAFPEVPAGSYDVRVRRHGTADGWLIAGVANDQFSIVTRPLGDFDAGVRIDLPVDVRAIAIRADEDARGRLDAVTLVPLVPAAVRLSSSAARRAVRYGDTVAYFLDDRAFPEPAGFWIGGAREASVAIRPDRPGPRITLDLRNAPVANQVRLDSGVWHDAFALAPGEQRRVEVPIDPAAGAAAIRIGASAGFRPSEGNADSRDTRFLGVYVRVAGG